MCCRSASVMVRTPSSSVMLFTMSSSTDKFHSTPHPFSCTARQPRCACMTAMMTFTPPRDAMSFFFSSDPRDIWNSASLALSSTSALSMWCCMPWMIALTPPLTMIFSVFCSLVDELKSALQPRRWMEAFLGKLDMARTMHSIAPDRPMRSMLHSTARFWSAPVPFSCTVDDPMLRSIACTIISTPPSSPICFFISSLADRENTAAHARCMTSELERCSRMHISMTRTPPSCDTRIFNESAIVRLHTMSYARRSNALSFLCSAMISRSSSTPPALLKACLRSFELRVIVKNANSTRSHST
mmetsp:Transcript_48067/g.120987  ORF Transcript_48067/g.120987 Transcript_48067/m.120987 type:complete len:300 (-) Transcript_48067:395-1294(-)